MKIKDKIYTSSQILQNSYAKCGISGQLYCATFMQSALILPIGQIYTYWVKVLVYFRAYVLFCRQFVFGAILFFLA